MPEQTVEPVVIHRHAQLTVVVVQETDDFFVRGAVVQTGCRSCLVNFLARKMAEDPAFKQLITDSVEKSMVCKQEKDN